MNITIKFESGRDKVRFMKLLNMYKKILESVQYDYKADTYCDRIIIDDVIEQLRSSNS